MKREVSGRFEVVILDAAHIAAVDAERAHADEIAALRARVAELEAKLVTALGEVGRCQAERDWARGELARAYIATPEHGVN